MTTKTVSCPSCGASATNHQNCEFCGSLFVRITQTNLNISKYTDDKNLIYIYENLENKIIEALDKCKTNQYVNLYIKFGAQNIVQLSRSSMIKDYLDGFGIDSQITNNNGIGIVKMFENTDTTYFNRFLDLEESILFFQSPESDNRFFAIDFNEDSRGSSMLISIILDKVFRISHDMPLDYEIEFWNDNDSNNGGCFIATATMGDYDHPDVMELRHLRDEWILNKSWGNSFVKWYYHYGAMAARVIEKSTILKKVSYITIVKPLVYLSRVVNQK